MRWISSLPSVRLVALGLRFGRSRHLHIAGPIGNTEGVSTGNTVRGSTGSTGGATRGGGR